MLSLQGWPDPTNVTAKHWWLDWPQPSPETQSTSSSHGAPAAPGLWHVELPEEEGQMRGAAHAPSSVQGVPAPPGAAHTVPLL
jgi:hypothetical protein